MRQHVSLIRMRLYLDTSVIGGCLDNEFAVPSTKLLDQVRKGRHLAIISDLTRVELLFAPPAVRRVMEALPAKHIVPVALTGEAAVLAEAYVAARVIAAGNKIDAQHIAIATVCKADILVSWNFKHIVNVARISGYNSVNLARGYRAIDIREPREII